MKVSFVAAVFLVASAAFAANNRSAVSVTGSDSNPCSVALPCRSFSVALTNTVVGGEIIALDSAGYGPFTINQSVTVSGAPGVHAAISAPGGDAIDITSGTVTLRNLVLIGNGSGFNGILFSGGVALHVSNCVITGFTNRGVQSSASGTLTFIDRTTIESTTTAIEVDDTTGFVYDSTIINCGYGARALATTGVANAQLTLVNNRIAGSTAFAVEATGFGAGNLASVTLDRNSLSQNFAGLSLAGGSGGNAVARLTNNDIDSINASGTYTITTYGNNSIGNTGGATLTPAALQ